MVRAAVKAAEGPVYVRKQIVHNTHVVAELVSLGVIFVDDLDAVPDGATVVFSAHGVSPAVWAQAHDRHLDVLDATCPLVSKVHAEARRFAARGDTVILIGHAGHEEVAGTLGQAPGSIVLVESVGDIAGLQVADESKVSYLTQTTLSVDETSLVIDALRQRFPLLQELATEDICYATTNRQNAVRALLDEADLLLVIGSANSSNSLRLVELAGRHGVPAYLIDDADDLDGTWLEGADTVAVTAGASAPPVLVKQVVVALEAHGPVRVEERALTIENIRFSLPPKVHRR